VNRFENRSGVSEFRSFNNGTSKGMHEVLAYFCSIGKGAGSGMAAAIPIQNLVWRSAFYMFLSHDFLSSKHMAKVVYIYVGYTKSI